MVQRLKISLQNTDLLFVSFCFIFLLFVPAGIREAWNGFTDAVNNFLILFRELVADDYSDKEVILILFIPGEFVVQFEKNFVTNKNSKCNYAGQTNQP